ncbi:MAG: SGNH/GDSL hydrolase family protein [Candidatus Melainabacteria bacterium]|nr:MAG: SGNH/GDSL hydrolase family protein [Candidatus Melainabacteria bacterium]
MVVSTPQSTQERINSTPLTTAPKKKTWLKTAAQIVAWQIVALSLIEVVMASAGLGEEEIFRLDKQIGFTHIPNKRIYWKQEGPGVYSYFNADGMREPGLTIAKPAGTYRIAVLGDSLVEGLQSPIEKTFGYRMGKELTKKLNRPVEVLNFGNSGYSTAQEYLQLKKVWKYSPDMVLLGYSNRDIFENWSPPDETITNVRPYALHLPNSHLVVDNSSVTNWMRTPRAKFLMAITPIREYSHVWGMISAAETQFGHSDPIYKAISEFLTNPAKSLKNTWAALPGWLAALPQNTIKSLAVLTVQPVNHVPPPAKPQAPEESVDPTVRAQALRESTAKEDAAIAAAAQEEAIRAEAAQLAAANTAAKDAATQSAITTPPDAIPNHPESKGVVNKQRNVFLGLLTRTLGSLLAEMKAESAKHGAKFLVVAMPSRSFLCADPAAPKDGFDLPYPEEVSLVKKLCADDAIPIFDAEAAMEKLEPMLRTCEFYSNHLTPRGHAFVAKSLQPFIEKQIETESKP